MISKITCLIIIFCSTLIAQEVIDITVKGISNSENDGAQKDRQEAIMDAKRQACEKSGVRLQSNTNVENFQVTFDYIESKAAAVLLPGFQVVDVGSFWRESKSRTSIPRDCRPESNLWAVMEEWEKMDFLPHI